LEIYGKANYMLEKYHAPGFTNSDVYNNVLYSQNGKNHIWHAGSYVVLELFKIKCMQYLLFQISLVILGDPVYYPALPWLMNPYPVNPHITTFQQKQLQVGSSRLDFPFWHPFNCYI